MGLLSKAARGALRSGHMFTVPGAEAGLTRPVMHDIAGRMIRQETVAPDLVLGREIAEKFYRGETLSELERRVFDEMIKTVRNNKMAKMLTGETRQSPFDEFIR